MSALVGIDLGTTNCVIAYHDGRRSRVLGSAENRGLLPSVFSYEAPGGGRPGSYLVGVPARHNWQAAPRDTVVCVKRLMGRFVHEPEVAETKERSQYVIVAGANNRVELEVGGERLTPAQIASAYLKALRERAEAELRISPAPDQPLGAVITVPAYFEERQRAATREAGELAGLRVRRLIDEPTAAALAYLGMAPREPQTLMVFDLGGGTFDISLMHLAWNARTNEPIIEVLYIDGDNFLGGSDFDEAVYHDLVADFRRQNDEDPTDDPAFKVAVRREIERCKIHLSDDTEDKVYLANALRRGDRGYNVNYRLTRAAYEELIRPRVDQVMRIVDHALDAASSSPDSVDRVLLIGGASQTPLIRKRLGEKFGEDRLVTDLNPMTAVAEGAAFLASRIRGTECPNAECGETRKVKDHRTAREITVREPTVNDEDLKACKKCGTALEAGRTSTEGLRITDKTAFSLGVLVVKGSQAGVYDPLIPKNTSYPLAEPITQSYLPNDRATRKLIVPVFEAVDDAGYNRKFQGNVEYQLPEAISHNTKVHVSFNLDRSRVVTVTIRVDQPGIAPLTQPLVLNEPPSEPGSAPRPGLLDALENLVRHTRTMRDRYTGFIEPEGLQLAMIDGHLQEANVILTRAQTNPGQYRTEDVNRLIANLEKDLMESGAATQLYLGDLIKEDPRASDLHRGIQSSQDDYRQARGQGESRKANESMAALKTAIAKGMERRHPELADQVVADTRFLLRKEL
jgi:molecular chaperone DnaK